MALAILKRSARRVRHSPLIFVLALMALTLLLRTWDLAHTPPWLWFDEAGNGLDARELLHGQFQLFFPRSLGKEPLYNYLITPFVAAWDGTTFAVRLPATLLGTLMIPALYAMGRALWPEDRRRGIVAGLMAAGFWAVNYWPQSINRISFRANTLPLAITLAVAAWLIWTGRPDRRRAIMFGVLAALTQYTYLAGRAVLLLWPLLFLALPADRRRALRPTLATAALAFGLAVAPLAGYLALQPEDAFQRVGTVVSLAGAPNLSEKLTLGGESLVRVLGGFIGLAGDLLPRHNLPDRPPFSWPLAVLFVFGLSMLLYGLAACSRPVTGVRGLQTRWEHKPHHFQRSWTLLLWWGVMILPAVLAAENNPHFLRLFGALPAALLIASAPVAWAIGRMQDFQIDGHAARGVTAREKVKSGRSGRSASPILRAALRWSPILLLAGFIALEGITTARAYFVDWGHKTDLYEAYQGDIWTYGAQVHGEPDAIGVVSRSAYFYILDYAFKPTSFLQVSVAEDELEAELARNAAALKDARVIVPAWRDGLLVDTDPKEALPFYLAREGALIAREPFRGFDLLTFQLGPDPQFVAAGHQQPVNVAFSNGFQLLAARWGAAYPNPQRDGAAAQAGTPAWAVLTWGGPTEAVGPMPDLKVALDIVDAAGRRLASDERPLLDAQHLPVSRWRTGVTARSYHLVTLPATQLPGPARLAARMYEAESLAPVRIQGADARLTVEIAPLQVEPNPRPVAAEMLPLRQRLDLPAAPGITLLGLAPWPKTTAPGQTLPLRAYWQITAPADATALAFTLGEDIAQAVAQLPVGLPAGSIVHTDLDLRLPPETPSGVYLLRLGQAWLGDVTVAGRSRQFAAPALWLSAQASYGEVVTLLGINGEAAAQAGPDLLRVTAGQALTLTLVWRADRTAERELVRFVHLVGSDGRPAAQEDVVPCQAACPATSWLPGEILLDQATLPIPPALAPGRYPLTVGWYDLATVTRLPARDATGAALPDDALRPLIVEVTP